MSFVEHFFTDIHNLQTYCIQPTKFQVGTKKLNSRQTFDSAKSSCHFKVFFLHVEILTIGFFSNSIRILSGQSNFLQLLDLT